MKKIIYTLFIASLFASACTKEVLVTRDHDINAETEDIETKMTMTALYCNLNDSDAIDLSQLKEYLTEKDADLVTLVSPTAINGVTFKTWLNDYAKEADLIALSVVNEDSRLIMAALVDKKYEGSIEQINMSGEMKEKLKNAVLHFTVNGMHVVVTEFEKARRRILDNWAEIKEQMLNNNKLVWYENDCYAERQAEVEYFVSQTIEHKDYGGVKYWLWCMDTNVMSSLDANFGRELRMADCYDNFPWDRYDEFFKKTHKNWNIPEYFPADDLYYSLTNIFVRCGVLDTFVMQHSVYTPSSVDGNRENRIYTSEKLWNLFDKFDVDKNSTWGATHYPIMITLKVEE